jgi:hypothetical protein
MVEMNVKDTIRKINFITNIARKEKNEIHPARCALSCHQWLANPGLFLRNTIPIN